MIKKGCKQKHFLTIMVVVMTFALDTLIPSTSIRIRLKYYSPLRENVPIWSFFWSVFSCIRDLYYSVNLRIQSKYLDIHTVHITLLCSKNIMKLITGNERSLKQPVASGNFFDQHF